MEDIEHELVRESGTEYISSHRQLKIYRRAFDLAIRIQSVADQLPACEQRRLADQMIRSARSLCSNIAEAWRKRRYKAHFVSKLSDAEGEAAETQTWLEFASVLEYGASDVLDELDQGYGSYLDRSSTSFPMRTSGSLFRRRAKLV